MKYLTAWAALICMAVTMQGEVPTARKQGAVVQAVNEEEPKIPGQVLARANGTFLGLELEQGKFKLSFYDAKKKPMNVDVARAVGRWPNVHGPGSNRTVLNPNSEGNALVGAQFVRGPYVFNLILVLIKEDGETAESYSVPFRG
jgi:hypothetical protein